LGSTADRATQPTCGEAQPVLVVVEPSEVVVLEVEVVLGAL
jgi:hypothetical protein